MTFSLANYLHEFYRIGPPVSFTTHLEYVPIADPSDARSPGIESFAFVDRPHIPFVVTSHAPYRKGLYPGRIVLILRDPRDVLVSFYHYLTKYLRLVDDGFSDFLRGTRGTAAVGMPSPPHALSRYLDSWVTPVLNGSVAVTYYETWRASPEEGLTKLLGALKLPIDRSIVATACARSDFKSMRQAEAEHAPYLPARGDTTRERPAELSDPNAHFVRRARVGSWETELNERERAELCHLLDKEITHRTKTMFRQLGLPYGFSKAEVETRLTTQSGPPKDAPGR